METTANKSVPPRGPVDKLVSLFGLDEFGWETMTAWVRWQIRAMAGVLASVFLFEFAAWTYYWYLNLQVLGWGRAAVAPFFGAIFAGVALVLNASIAGMWRTQKSSLSESVMVGLRVILIIALAYFMAGPLSVLKHDAQIRNWFDQQDDLNFKQVVEARATRVKAQFDEQISQKEVDIQREVTQITARFASDVAQIERQREADRKALVVSLDAAVKQQDAAVLSANEDRKLEREKGGVGRPSGEGRFFKSKQADYESAQKRLIEMQLANIEELRKFDVVTANRVQEKTTARDGQIKELTVTKNPVDALRLQLRAKIDEVRNRQPGSGLGESKVARDYAASQNALDHLEKVNTALKGERFNAIVLMMLLSFGLLAMKFMFGMKLRQYQDPVMQAAVGNVAAQQLLKAQGISDAQAHGRPDEVREARKKLIEATRALMAECAAMDRLLFDLVRPLPVGVYRSAQNIERALRDAWQVKLLPARDAFVVESRRVTEAGYDVSGIPVVLKDLPSRWAADQPSFVGEQDLIAVGWVKPDAEMRSALELAQKGVLDLQRNILEKVRTIRMAFEVLKLQPHEDLLRAFRELHQEHAASLAQMLSEHAAHEQTLRDFAEDIRGPHASEASLEIWSELELEAAKCALRAGRRAFEGKRDALDNEFALLVCTINASTPLPVLVRRRRSEWLTQLAPILAAVQACEDVYFDRGLSAPPWLPMDPRSEGAPKHWELAAANLHGWSGDQSQKSVSYISSLVDEARAADPRS